jgi:hypothetical protein
MSTELKVLGDHLFSLTRYSGGFKGPCIQITGPNSDGKIGYIGMTREQAAGLAIDLIAFANFAEIEESNE